jgi:hypothetical protein
LHPFSDCRFIVGLDVRQSVKPLTGLTFKLSNKSGQSNGLLLAAEGPTEINHAEQDQ